MQTTRYVLRRGGKAPGRPQPPQAVCGSAGAVRSRRNHGGVKLHRWKSTGRRSKKKFYQSQNMLVCNNSRAAEAGFHLRLVQQGCLHTVRRCFLLATLQGLEFVSGGFTVDTCSLLTFLVLKQADRSPAAPTRKHLHCMRCQISLSAAGNPYVVLQESPDPLKDD